MNKIKILFKEKRIIKTRKTHNNKQKRIKKIKTKNKEPLIKKHIQSKKNTNNITRYLNNHA